MAEGKKRGPKPKKGKTRNVIFEAITTVVFKQELEGGSSLEVTVRVYNDRSLVKDVPYQTEVDCGTEVWEWGDKHWDTFTPETIPLKFKLAKNKTISADAEIIWRCITAVLDPRTKKPLKMRDVSKLGNWKNHPRSASDMKKTGRKTKTAKEYVGKAFDSAKQPVKKTVKKDDLGLTEAPTRSKQLKKAAKKAVS